MLEWLDKNFNTLFTPTPGVPAPGCGDAECYTHVATGRRLVRRLVRGDFSLYETLQSLDHPSLQSIYEVIPCDDGAVIFEEYPNGTPLKSVLRSGLMPEKKAVGEFIGICEGVAALHEAGISHGAILPGSILVNKKGSLRLYDYGSASHLDRYSDLDDTALLPHPAPSAAPDPFVRKDILSLGVLLNLLLTGAYPETYLCRGRYSSVVRRCIESGMPERFTSAGALCRRVKEVAR